jgi:predicted DCC family thiol-disulfide oxidoreductase YuxK
MGAEAGKYPVIYFDGECNLCNGFVLYVIRHDRQARFRFAALQSDFAAGRGFTIPKHSDGSLETMVVEWGGEVLQFSTGVIRVLESLDGWNRLFSACWLIPRLVRDAIYRWLARRRYFFFGKADTCAVPTTELQARFLS